MMPLIYTPSNKNDIFFENTTMRLLIKEQGVTFIRNPLIYMVGRAGIEPTTNGLKVLTVR